MFNKKISVGITVSLMAVTAAVTFVITNNYSLSLFNSKVQSVTEREEIYTKLSELDSFARTKFYKEIDEDYLMECIAKGYIFGLQDNYAEYYTAEEYAKVTQKDSGYTMGLGFTFEKEESGYIKVTSVMVNTAAHEAGMQAGDVILAVNDTDVIAYEGGYNEAVALLDCAEGTKVKLAVRRRVEAEGAEATVPPQFLNFELVSRRDEIVSVTGRMIDDRYAYIKISTFNSKTAEQLKAQLDELTAAGAVGIVFDVRDNLGGLVTSLSDCLNLIIGECDPVTAEYKDRTEVTVHTTAETEIKLPITVLVNGKTASCSELFALALRDEKNAQLVGTTTYGKGVMQTTHKLRDGSAVKVTVAVLKTKNSGEFTGVGVKPNFEMELPDGIDSKNITIEQQLNGLDTQLSKALEVLDTTLGQQPAAKTE